MATYWLIGVTVLLASTLAWLLRELIQVRRRQANLRARIDELSYHIQLQAQSINGLAASAIGVDRRLQLAETKSLQLVDRQSLLENREPDERPYDRAIRMVKQGAGVRRLVEELELSESEADLIIRIHGASAELKSVEI